MRGLLDVPDQDIYGWVTGEGVRYRSIIDPRVAAAASREFQSVDGDAPLTWAALPPSV